MQKINWSQTEYLHFKMCQLWFKTPVSGSPNLPFGFVVVVSADDASLGDPGLVRLSKGDFRDIIQFYPWLKTQEECYSRSKYSPCKFSKFKTVYWWWRLRWKFCPYFRVCRLSKEGGLYGPTCGLAAPARPNGILVSIISVGVPCKKNSSGPETATTDRNITQ